MLVYQFHSKKLDVYRNSCGITFWRKKEESYETTRHKLRPNWHNFNSIHTNKGNTIETYRDMFVGKFINQDLSTSFEFKTNIPELRLIWVSFDDSSKLAFLRPKLKVKLDKAYLQSKGTKLSKSRLVEKFNITDGAYLLPDFFKQEFKICDNVREIYNDRRVPSCMTNKEYLISFYESIGVKILAYYKNDKLNGRALLFPDGDKYVVDRAYGCNNDDKLEIYKYADSQQWDRREDFNPYYGNLMSGRNLHFKINRLDNIPWIDTFRNAYLKGGEWFITNDDDKGIIKLQRSGGASIITCPQCGGWTNGEECENGCNPDNLAVCAFCDEAFNEDEGRQTHDGWVCENCINSDYFYCDRCDTYYHNDNFAEDFEGDAYCQNCFDRNLVICSECGEILRYNDCIEHDGESYCRSCFDDLFFQCDYCDNTCSRDELNEVGDLQFCNDCTPEEEEEKVILINQETI